MLHSFDMGFGLYNYKCWKHGLKFCNGVINHISTICWLVITLYSIFHRRVVIVLRNYIWIYGMWKPKCLFHFIYKEKVGKYEIGCRILNGYAWIGCYNIITYFNFMMYENLCVYSLQENLRFATITCYKIQ